MTISESKSFLRLLAEILVRNILSLKNYYSVNNENMHAVILNKYHIVLAFNVFFRIKLNFVNFQYENNTNRHPN